jgi:cytochrome c
MTLCCFARYGFKFRAFEKLCGLYFRLVAGIMIVALLANEARSNASVAPPDYRFKVEVLARSMPRPLQLQADAEGRIFFNELGGKLKIWRPGGEVLEAGSVPVFDQQENGFLGFALDPGFAQNHWIYLLYSPTNFVGQRLSRFVMDGDRLDPSSEKEVFKFGEQRRECCHHAGSMRFAPDGCLLISTGDNTNPFGDSESYGPMDERPDREPWDAQRTSGNTGSYNGKILRIRPTPDGGYTIPDGNLFPKDGSGGCPEIFVMGCRNPWRMNVDEKTGIVYWGDVGPDAWGDGPRGSRGYDEINQARVAGNFGWPYFVGSNFAYYKFDYATKTAGAKFDPARPVNESVNNTGARVLPPAQPAMIYWPYGTSKEFPMLGNGGRTACAGPVFHFKPEFEKTGGFPEHFEGALLFWDWQRPFMKWARLDHEQNFKGIEFFTAAVIFANTKESIEAAEKTGAFVIRRPVDAMFGRDGCLYMLDYGESWGVNTDSKLLKISYQWGNLAPIAKASAVPTAGREPLTISLSSEGSKDLEGDSIRYEWQLFESSDAAKKVSGKIVSTEPRFSYTVQKPGNYVVQLTVTDDKGANSKSSLPLVVGNSPPQVRFERPEEGDFFTPGRSISYALHVVDAEDGDSRHNDELMEAGAFVNGRWSRAENEEEIHQGLTMMKHSDCFNCHATEIKIVGPAYLEVANKYRGQARALDDSVERVIKGSSGIWGSTPMLPHESFTKEQVRQMVQWVFELKPGQNGAHLVRGLTGQIPALSDKMEGQVVLDATYTDAGRAPAGTLTGNSHLTLRSRRIEAEKGDILNGGRIESNNSASGRSMLAQLNRNHTVRFDNLNLTDTASLTCRVANGGTNDAVIEFRNGSRDGAVIASLETKPSGGWDKWVELTAFLKAKPMGRGAICLTFSSASTNRLMNLDWVQFNAQ